MGYKSTGTLNLRRFVNQQLAGLETKVAQKAAAEIADEITRQARASFDAGKTVYGDARQHHDESGRKFNGREYKGRAGTGSHGLTALTLVRTGATRSSLTFTSDGGTKVRAVLGQTYMKYLIGKYVILPIGNAALPFRWLVAIRLIFIKHTWHQVRRAA